MGVALDDALRSHLDVAAEFAGHSVAEEIRKRLQRTINEDQRPLALRDLLQDIERLTNLVENDTDWNWNDHPFAFAVFQAGVAALLEQRKPADNERLLTVDHDFHRDRRISDSDDPGTIGRALVRHLEREQRYREAKRRQPRKKGEADAT